MNNNIKTYFLLAAIVALFVFIGGLVGGKTGMFFALIFAIVINFTAYYYSADMILKMYKAQEVSLQNAPDLYNMVLELANTANMPMPKVYVIDEEQPNAFATGRDLQNSAVVFSVGIMKLLDYDELRAVAGHELSHILHRDILISTIAAIVAGAIAGIANFALFFGARDEEGRSNIVAGILIAILAPIAAAIIQMAISRSREYLADEGSANLTRQPLALANALLKIESYVQNIAMPSAENHPSTAQMMIINPLSSNHKDNLFSTHPATANRVERLQLIAASWEKH
jgi:heat shock protein HtpX